MIDGGMLKVIGDLLPNGVQHRAKFTCLRELE